MASQPESLAEVFVRRAVTDEIEMIASVLRQAFAEYEPLYTPAAFAATTPTANQLQERWREGAVWVAIQKSDIVGTVGAVSKSSGLYVRSMALLPAARGQRIAVKLLDEMESFANANHHPRLFLSTTPFLTQAIRLYQRFGFERTEEGPHDLFGTPLFTMVKPLETAQRELG